MATSLTRRDFAASAILLVAGSYAGWTPAQAAESKPAAKLLVLYKTPKDKAAFDAYYKATHIPLASKIPGLRAYEISEGVVNTPAGPSDIYLTAILTFDNLAAIQAGLASPEGQAAAGDLANFATGGADLFMFDSKDA